MARSEQKRLAELGATIDLYRKGSIEEQDEAKLRLLFGPVQAESIKRDVEKMLGDSNAREKGQEKEITK